MQLSTSKIAVVGPGRLGSALAAQLGPSLTGAPLGRGATCEDADIVLLCVPDSEIAAAAAAVKPGRLVGHCSGATTLEPLVGHEGFSLHPLMTITERGARFDGASAAVAGSTARALAVATALAEHLGMHPFEVSDDDRAAYHASASIASNFLVTLVWAAERMSIDREALLPLVRATVDNWAQLGPERALTGPIARGDEQTVDLQRAAVAQRAPELLDLFDALAETTRALAAQAVPA